MYAAGHRAANARLARRPAWSPSSITTNSRKYVSSNSACRSDTLAPIKATTLP